MKLMKGMKINPHRARFMSFVTFMVTLSTF